MWMRSPHRSFGLLHLLAAFCALSAGVSAIVSEYPTVAIAKAASLFLLFLYGAAGARMAVLGREEKFFRGLVLALEVAVSLTALCYFVLGLKVFGNPNSLGAAMGIGVFPVLLWAWLSSQKRARARTFFALFLCGCLLLFSLARAAILASACVSLVLCISLREYKLLLKGAAILVLGLSVTAILAPSFFEGVVTEFSDAVLYKGHRSEGILGSRQSPWDVAMTDIKSHPFFGTGFGTSPTGEDPGFVLGKFQSASELNREHGSSYLAIAGWVGLLGLLPFIALLLLVVSNVWKVCFWMRGSGNPSHFAVPLAMVLTAGLIHAGFEDWLFAVGYYVSVYFWVLAFILADLVPAAELRSPVRSGAIGRGAYRLETVDSTR
jgi:O-antigen ligase